MEKSFKALSKFESLPMRKLAHWICLSLCIMVLLPSFVLGQVNDLPEEVVKTGVTDTFVRILFLFALIFIGMSAVGVVLVASMKKFNIGPKIWIVFSTISILAVAIIGTNAFIGVKNALQKESFLKLTAIREVKSMQIENYVNILRDQVSTFSEDRMIIDAMKSFQKAFSSIQSELQLNPKQISALDSRLDKYYSESFLPRLNPNLDKAVTKDAYLPVDVETRILQDLYIANNQNEVGQKHLLDDAGDGSAYSETHRLYHPIIRHFLEKFGYYDIFLIDSKTGHIVYSVFKEVDFGTSLINGPYKRTNFARAFAESNTSNSNDFVKLIDFEPYHPSYNGHASFISSPIFDGEEKVGVLVFQMPIDRINDIMTSNQDWFRVGLGASGETYILGSDLTMRNQSRFLIEDRDNYLKSITAGGTSDSIVDRIDRLNSSVGLQQVNTLGSDLAFKGESGTQLFPDYRQVEVLSSFKPLNLKDVNWVIMSEIDASEAFSHITVFRNKLIGWVVGLFVAISAFALYFSKSLTNPIKTLAEHATKVSEGDLSTEISISNQDEIGALAINFETMRLSLKRVIGELEEINAELENKVDARTSELSAQTKELERERVLLEAVLGSIEQGLLAYDENLNLIVANRRFKEIRDIPDDLMVPGTPFESLIRYDLKRDEFGDVDLEKELTKQLERAKSFSVHNFERERPDGTIIEVQGGPIPSGGFVSTFTDITERKRSEKRLQQSEEKFRKVSESTIDAIITISDEGLVTAWNPAAEELFQYNHSDIIGQSVELIIPSDRVKEHRSGMARFLKTKISRIIGQVVELIGVRKDGTELPIEMALSTWDFEERTFFTAIIRDITARKKMEAELKETSSALANQLAFNEALVDSIPNPIFVKDPDTRFTTFNKAYERAFGIERIDYIGKTILEFDFMSKQDRDGFQKEDVKQLEKGGLALRELQIPFADGTEHTMLYWTTTFDLADKSRGGLLGVLVDISAQKRLEKELAKANERMEDELNIGREIQMSMLPLIFPAFPDRKEFSVFASLYPAREVGGDFYDFFLTGENKFCFVIADVSGKGVPAALFMAVTKTLIKSRASTDDSPSSILEHVNNEISADNDAGMFVTVFLGIIDLDTGITRFTNAGHNPPYIKRKAGDLEIVDQRHGLVIGAMEDVKYGEDEFTLKPGDHALLFTDGVTEAMNKDMEQFDEERLEATLSKRKFVSAEDMTHSIVEAVKKFEDGADQFDDITVLAFKYLGESSDEILQELNVVLRNDLTELQRLEHEMEAFLEENRVKPTINSHLNMVFDELLNNVISYGYDDDGDHEIRVQLQLLDKRLRIIITDDGKAFNPFAEEKPDTILSLEEREIGGLGIHLVRNVMDKFEYSRQLNKNIVTMEKHLTSHK